MQDRAVLPGFRLAMSWTLFYLGLLVLIPLGTILHRSATLPWADRKCAATAALFR